MITYREITEAVRKDPECKAGYHIVARGSDIKLIVAAINQGIDSRLEACFIHGRDRYEPKRGAGPLFESELDCWVSAESLPVLLRRLSEMCDEAHLLASDILGTLGFEEADAFDIISPADETVACKLCNKDVPAITAHRHQGSYVGEDCCWDERLRMTE